MKFTPAEKELLHLVAGAAFANPFGEERASLDQALAALPGAEADSGPPLPRALRKLEQVVEDWRKAGRADVRKFPAEWREQGELLFLFVQYHRVNAAFDAHIEEQAREGERPLPAPFVAGVLDALASFGFARPEALKYAGLFFQLRRAYHFIAAGLVGRAACMEALRRRLWGNLFTGDMRWYVRHLWNRMEDYSTLLVGETGAGKGAAAAALGRSGYIPFDDRRGTFTESFTRAFVPLNLAECPPALLESELFGHRKGAFTGALADHDGVFARCSRHGAIFLDEIGEAAPATQVKLLRVLQDRHFTPVGGRAARRFEGRVIAATNADLQRARAEGRFREDFYFRLCSDLIAVPSLRERLRDAPLERDELVAVILGRLSGQADAELSARVRAALDRDVPPDYAWPGNVRELEQAVRRILLTGAYRPASAEAVAGGGPRAQALARRMQEGALDAETLLSEYCALLYERDPSYASVARVTGLDRRTVKRRLDALASG